MDKIYLYDKKKKNGYVYIAENKLYRPIHIDKPDKYNIIDEDLRPVINIIIDEIPVSTELMLNIRTLIPRPRTAQDYFTYELKYPIYNHNLLNYLTQLIPFDLLQFKNFLRKSLTTNNLIYTINGSNTAINNLFNLLLKLDPLIMKGSNKLVCEKYVSLKYFSEIETAKIGLFTLQDRTIRIAQPKSTFYIRPIQINYLIYTNESPINIFEVENKDFSSEELLDWIIF